MSVQLAMPLHQRRNVLIVEESTVEDICVSLAQEKLDEMKIFRGDVILIAGNFASETVAIAIAGEGCGFDRIRMHASIRQNLNVSVGETVSVFFCLPENGIKVQIHRSIDDALTQCDASKFLKRYFAGNYLPVHQGDVIFIPTDRKSLKFKVVSTQPGPFCTVTDVTAIECDKQEKLTTWSDIGGLAEVKVELTKILQKPSAALEDMAQFPMQRVRAVMLYGPPGCGKKLLTTTAAQQCGSKLISVNAENLQERMVILEIFTNVQSSTEQCVLLINGLDLIAEVQAKQTLSKIIADMGRMNLKNLVLMATTKRTKIIDVELWHSGPSMKLLEVPRPCEQNRLDILNIKMRGIPRAQAVNYQSIAHATEGCSGRDLAEMCSRACANFLRDANVSTTVAVKPLLETYHFEEAMRTGRRSVPDTVIREYFDFKRNLCSSRGIPFSFTQ